MKRVKILQQVSGTRNGQEWPPKGAEWELPDAEAESYAIAGIVEILEEHGGSYEPDKDVERAVGKQSDVETRAASAIPYPPDEPGPTAGVPTPPADPPGTAAPTAAQAAPRKSGPVTRATGPVPK